YWRVEVSGTEHLPRGGRVLLVSNHAGLVPWDALMLRQALVRAGLPEVRFLLEDLFFHAPFLGPSLNRLGAVRACQENAQRLLEAGRPVIVFPEGTKGATKLYRDRYRLQRFGRGGFVRLAARTGATLVPVAMVGSEEVHPMLANLAWLARQVGLSFLPVTPTFPWLGPLGALPLPSKWLVRFGRPQPTRQLAPGAPEDAVQAMAQAEAVRNQIQDMTNDLLEERGHPFLGAQKSP
ncbi:MAG TPA: lysophospholipid acyltransferase family protein, partial [Myxococcota bacterium]|nr:lysophospholipid acyltransferase family protein [Myxococcota bacterium]